MDLNANQTPLKEKRPTLLLSLSAHASPWFLGGMFYIPPSFFGIDEFTR